MRKAHGQKSADRGYPLVQVADEINHEFERLWLGEDPLV